MLHQHSLLPLYQTVGRDVKFWGSSGASQPPPLAASVQRGPCDLISAGTNRQRLSLVSLLSLKVAWLETLGGLAG